MSALLVLILSIAVACGGGSDDNSNDDDEMEVVMSTFTPTSEADAANRDATRAAEEAAANETATAVAENPAPPPPTRDPNATQVVPTVDPEAADGLRPPRAWISNGENQWEGVFGNFSLVHEETGTVANATAPFYDVGDEGLTVAPGGELEFILQDDVTAPSSMTGEPTAVTVEVYTWEGNNAIPTTQEGDAEDNLWFVPAQPPVISSPMDLEAGVFTMPATPDRYVVRVQVDWPAFDNELTPQPIPVYAVYAFTVYVE